MSSKPLGLHGLLQGYIFIKYFKILQHFILLTNNVVQFYFKISRVCMHLYTQWSGFVKIFSAAAFNLILVSSLFTQNMSWIKNHKSCSNLPMKMKLGEVCTSADEEVISLWKMLKLFSFCVRTKSDVTCCSMCMYVAPSMAGESHTEDVVQTLRGGITSVSKGTQCCQISFSSIKFCVIYN
jgi:hypothetical protein